MDVTLVPVDLATIEAAIVGDEALAAALGHPVAPGWVSFDGALTATRDLLAAGRADPVWGTRLFVAATAPGGRPELVGWGGYKGPPADGVVELGYEVAPTRRRRGIATGAARAMLAEAFADPAVVAVIAHTLPERNTSNGVLDRVGFRFDGEAVEGGEPVWRFRIDRP